MSAVVAGFRGASRPALVGLAADDVGHRVKRARLLDDLRPYPSWPS